MIFSEKDQIRTAIEQNEFLRHVLSDNRTQDTFINCLYKEDVKKDEILIEKGQPGSHLYISLLGTYRVMIDDGTDVIFEDIRVFGEIAVLYSAKRTATVKVIENGTLWALDCRTYKKLTIKSAIKQQEEMVTFLMNIPNLNRISEQKLYLVANLLKPEFFKSSEIIVKQCENGDKFYIIRAGNI